MGGTRLDDARGKKQVWRPVFEPEVFRKQCTVLKKVLVTLLGLFFVPCSDSVPVKLCPACPLVVTPLHIS